jgi:hypothetical protein
MTEDWADLAGLCRNSGADIQYVMPSYLLAYADRASVLLGWIPEHIELKRFLKQRQS